MTNILNRNFTLVVAGQIVSILGSAILRFALNLYVLDITGRADIFCLGTGFVIHTRYFFSLVGGAIADRFNRRNLMVIFDFANSTIVLVLFLLLKFTDTSIVSIGMILAILSIISAMYQPTVQASVPLLVSDNQLISAMALSMVLLLCQGCLAPYWEVCFMVL